MFFIAYAFKGQKHVFAGRVKIVTGQVQYGNIFVAGTFPGQDAVKFRTSASCMHTFISI